MKGFGGSVVLKRISSEYYSLQSKLTYENSKYQITVLPGAKTNGASIPRLLWAYIGCPFVGKYVESAIVHDSLYASRILPREIMNDLFIDMLKANDVGYIKRTCMHLGVKLYSWFYYDEIETSASIKNKKYVNILRK